ncbi:MAG: hypothetical protein GX491_12180 [Chloroflexi bacterium]|nr:hypothetical protein [Chloroflexota bacterium]
MSKKFIWTTPSFYKNMAAHYPPATALILVALIPSPRDLEIARLLSWYRVPLRTAPKVINVDYLAFYQTSAFGEEKKWRIETIAEVRGNELTTRAELLRDEPDHPRAHEEYYKIQLGPLETLPRPILAGRWRRLTFLYTTGALLSQARTLNDLVVRSEEREILWRSLRERALQANQYNPSLDLPEIDLDPALLMMLGDLKHLTGRS